MLPRLHPRFLAQYGDTQIIFYYVSKCFNSGPMNAVRNENQGARQPQSQTVSPEGQPHDKNKSCSS